MSYLGAVLLALTLGLAVALYLATRDREQVQNRRIR
jgi:hypothetical protein